MTRSIDFQRRDSVSFQHRLARKVQTLSLLIASMMSAYINNPAYAQAPLEDKWHYTLDKPTSDWSSPDFSAQSWKSASGGFGTPGTPGSRIGTRWKTSDIWLRKSVTLESVPSNPALYVHHDEDVEIYINGTLVVSKKGYTQDYVVIPIATENRSLLRTGSNLIAVHCHQTAGGQFIDAHLIDADNVPTLPAPEGEEFPFISHLTTVWGEKVTADNAWQEYPRPQLERSSWTNLNGFWNYAITADSDRTQPQSWKGKILVPFGLESKLSGVQRRLRASEALWYQRTFDAKKSELRRTLLNFEAVDYQCEVFVNGKSIGSHTGGSTPFSFDVTDALDNSGKNNLVVRVEDKTMGFQLQGKQRPNPEGIWYTQVSGIWQTVWLEEVSKTYIEDLTIHTESSSGTISIRPEIVGLSDADSLHIVVKDGEKTVASETFSGSKLVQQTNVDKAANQTRELELKVPNAILWTPETPHLYRLEITLSNNKGVKLDQVQSYAGIRTIGKEIDEDAHLRMTLNGKPLFHWGPLDQGWWPDGLLTPPSDEAMLFDIEYLKAAGFNMIRKHIKVEPRRYYYHCDRLGMLVWQDQVSGAVNPPWTRLAPNPTDAEWPDAAHEQYMLELERMIDNLESHPSIVVWVPFNEAWGQHRSVEVGKWAVQRDPTRLINIASGGNFWRVGDIADEHNYPPPAFPLSDERFDGFIKVVGEFGGHGYPVPEHLWDKDADNWGYGSLPKTESDYRKRYADSLKTLIELKKQGIAAGVYTQTTDVEGEINGLMTYDRKVIKIPADELRKLHEELLRD